MFRKIFELHLIDLEQSVEAFVTGKLTRVKITDERIEKRNKQKPLDLTNPLLIVKQTSELV